MLQLFFAVAFSAVPLTLYIPPIRSLNLFVEIMEDFFKQTAIYTLRAYPRIRLGCSRIYSAIFSLNNARTANRSADAVAKWATISNSDR